MANKKTQPKTTPAKLADGEAVITKELAEKYEKQNQEQMIKSEKKLSGGKGANSLRPAGENAIGSASAERPKKPSAKAGPKKATVAIYSDRNVSWTGVGKISRGYNIVTPEQAEQWLTRNHVREATPEEVASEYGA